MFFGYCSCGMSTAKLCFAPLIESCKNSGPRMRAWVQTSFWSVFLWYWYQTDVYGVRLSDFLLTWEVYFQLLLILSKIQVYKHDLISFIEHWQNEHECCRAIFLATKGCRAIFLATKGCRAIFPATWGRPRPVSNYGTVRILDFV